MNGKKNDFNPDNERPGYGISNPDYDPIHTESSEQMGKGVTSDSEVSEEVGKRLADIEALDMSRIAIEVRAGRAKLSGTVRSDAQRKRVQEVVLGAPGVADCENDLTIEDKLA